MKFYGKIFVSTILQTALIFCYPYPYDQTGFIGKTYPKNYNKLQSNQLINIEPICRNFHFPETEYPLPSMSDSPFNFQEIEKKPCFKTHMNSDTYLKSDSKNCYNINFNNAYHHPLSVSYSDVGTFPDIEYPMSASELWRPYYWNCGNNYETLHLSQPTCPKMNQTLTCKELQKKFGKTSTRGTNIPVSTKSFSDPQRNFMMLKDKQQNNNIKLQLNNESNKLIHNKGAACKTTASKLASLNESRNMHSNQLNTKLSSVAENKSISNIELTNRKPKLLPENEGTSNICFNKNENVQTDCKLKEHEDAVKSYTEKFNHAMSAILKEIADNIISNEKNHPEQNVVDGGNMYALDSPITPVINFEDYLHLSPTENEVALYADEFNSKMTAIIKSVADNISSQYTELPSINFGAHTSAPINDFEPEIFINKYADTFNDEMTSIISSNFDDITSNNINCVSEMIADNISTLPNENSLQSNTRSVITNTLVDKGSDLKINYPNFKTDDDVCRTTDLLELSNKTLPKQESDTILVPDGVETKYENSNEDYTTCAYPESDISWPQSTVAPTIISVDTAWKASKVIEPDNVVNSDELEQYFMLV